MDDPIQTLRSHLEYGFLFDGDEPRGRLTPQFSEKVVREKDQFPHAFAAARKLKDIWLPTPARMHPDLHVDYAIVEDGSYHYRSPWDELVWMKPTPKDLAAGRRGRQVWKRLYPSAVWRPRLWLDLLLGHVGLSVLWSKSLLQDALFIDVDLTNDGFPITIERLCPALRAKLMAPFAEAFESLSVQAGVKLRPVYYSSGHSGYWICLPLERPITRMHAGLWVDEIHRRAADTDVIPFGADYHVEVGNIFPRCVRVPLGPHEETGLPAAFVDPETGEYRDQFEALMGIERSGIIPEDWLLGEGCSAGRNQSPGCRAVSPHTGSSGWLADEGNPAEDDAASPGADLDAPPGRAVTKTATTADRPSAAEPDPFPERPWCGLLPRRIEPETTHATLIDGGLLLRVEARLLKQGLLHWDGSWQPILDDLIEDLLSLYPDHRPRRGGQIEGYLRCDLEKLRSGTWEGVDTTAGAIDAEEAERCGELAAEIVAESPSLAVGDVTMALIQLVRCHHVNAWHHRIPFWGRNTLAEWCGFIQPGATAKETASQGKRAGRIVDRIREGSPDCILPLIVRTRRGSTGRASEYRFLWQNWGGPFTQYAAGDPAGEDQGGWRGSSM